MEYKRLGNSDMCISRIGVGAWALGGKSGLNLGAQDDRDSVAMIHYALDNGVNWIDTAPAYGLGHSEEVIGKALRGLAEKPFIFTKCGITWNGQGVIAQTLKAANVRKEAEDSLYRLGVETIDLYQIHWPMPEEGIEEAWQVMEEIRKEGKIRYLGVSNHSVEQIKRLEKIAPVTALQPPYNLLNRRCEDKELPFSLDNNIGVICYSPMASGLLGGRMTRERIAALDPDDYRFSTKDFKEPKLTRNLKIVDHLKRIGAAHNCSPGEVAIAWVLHNPAVTAAIAGLRTPTQAAGVLGAVNISLSDAEIELLQSL